MRHFFIDLENVRSAGLDGVTELTSDDRVYVFYSDNANTLTIPTLESIGNSQAKVQYLKITRTGSNAMDFQIVSLYSALIEREKSGSFFIISHDNGFKSAISFCQHYFTEYELVLASYPSIKTALSGKNEQKQNTSTAKGQTKTKGNKDSKPKTPAKNNEKQDDTAENAAACELKQEPETQNESSENGLKNGKSRRRRRGRGGKERDNEQAAEKAANEAAETAAAGNIANAADTDQNSGETQAEPVPAENETKPEKKSRRRRSRGKNKSEKAEAVQNNGDEASSKENGDSPESEQQGTESSKSKQKGSGSKQYVYDILADYASKNLLDVYVELIDEGIRKSRNRDALKAFFTSKCETQEAEALYSLVKIEFDSLRKAKK